MLVKDLVWYWQGFSNNTTLNPWLMALPYIRCLCLLVSVYSLNTCFYVCYVIAIYFFGARDVWLIWIAAQRCRILKRSIQCSATPFGSNLAIFCECMCVFVSLFDSTLFHFNKYRTAFVIHWRCVVIFVLSSSLMLLLLFSLSLSHVFLCTVHPPEIKLCAGIIKSITWMQYRINRAKENGRELRAFDRLLLLVFQTIFTF